MYADFILILIKPALDYQNPIPALSAYTSTYVDVYLLQTCFLIYKYFPLVFSFTSGFPSYGINLILA